MNDQLLTAADLAEHFGVTEAKVMEWQRVYDWPRIKVGRTIRWTQDQLVEIERLHSVTSEGVKPTPSDGRTALSAARAS